MMGTFVNPVPLSFLFPNFSLSHPPTLEILVLVGASGDAVGEANTSKILKMAKRAALTYSSPALADINYV
jgi:hypothetical protein